MTTFKSISLSITLLFVALSCKSNRYSFLDNYEKKTTPIVDSTNFSNHVEKTLLNNEERQLLSLDSIFVGQLNQNNVKIGISYVPEISDKFTSIVYYFYANSNELSAILVNYNQNHKVIDYQLIAYDEIAEAMLKTTGTIYNDRIVLKEYISDNPSTIIFDILENGTITRH